MAKVDNPAEDKAPGLSDLRSSVLKAHNDGVSPAANAEQHRIDSSEVLAILEAEEAAKARE